jgi:predicted DsbA family dithiol-disulfide isomerase
MPTTTLPIDVISDIVCPWCFIGTRRLEQALAPLAPKVTPKITYRPFLLDPSTPTEGTDLRARLRNKYGVDPTTMFARVESAARESGIPLDFAKVTRTVSTIAAHTLLRHAIAKQTQPALAHALFSAYFLEGLDVGEIATLARIASAHGFSVEEATALLRDDAELARTREEARGAAESGIQGVPFFVLDGRLAISGAQPVETFRAAIDEAIAGA